MPPINNLNPPPNPFWAFVADMQEHPWFAHYPPQYAPQQQPERTREHEAATAGDSNTEQHTHNVEDPPEVDPATLRRDREQSQESRGCGRKGRHRRDSSSSSEEGGRHRGWHGRGGRRWRRGFGDMGPDMPFGGPAWRPDGPQVAPGHGPFPHPGFGPGAHGRGGFRHHRGGPPHHFPGHPWSHAHHHGQGHRHGHRGPSPPPPPPPGPPGFDLGRFLNDLGSRIGIDLSGAAEGLGLDRFMPSNSPEVDFEPKVDIFDRETDYILHVSLPGAKKSDVGVDWDGEHSALRIAGVVHRPEVDERMLEQLVVDGRKRETGVFEKTIRLGTRRDPAVVDVAGIKAKMADGVLVVTVPKTEKHHWKRDVPIAKSATPSPARNEKHVMFDVDRDMVDLTADEPEHEIQMVDRAPPIQAEREKESKGKEKEAEHHAEKERARRESTGTMEAEQEKEPLPTYKATPQQHEREHDGSDWENFGSDDEGEFVKINVD